MIQIDYSYDNGFFTNNPAARAVMQQVATDLGNSISANLAAITPGAGNTWAASFYAPSTGTLVTVPNLNVGNDTITVYVGSRAMTGGEAGVGGFGGYSISGSQSWMSTVQTRDWNGFAPWGGSIAFDNTRNWYFGASASGIASNQLDFYSVATHELGHILGIGTATQWQNSLSGNSFVGTHAEAVYGGPVPISSDRDHWADGTTVNGQHAAMDPILNYGQRVTWSTLDAAALLDLGWSTATQQPLSPPPAVTDPAPNNLSLTDIQSVAFAGGTDGTVMMYTVSNGVLANTGQKITPFVGYHGVIRVASGDFNGDGVQDYAFTIGAGPQAVVEIINGRDGSILVGQTVIFAGFRGGLFIAAGDIDGTSTAQLAVAADAGAGPHIETFRVANGQLVLESSFFAFDNPNYTGGARVAIGDLNRDGFADLIVTTGGLAEGRVAMYSGASLRDGNAVRLYNDFNPFPGYDGGLNAAVGDMDGDGYGDLAITVDDGLAHVKVWSGATLASGVYPGYLPPVISFYALPTNELGGATLVLRDLNADGRADLVVASGDPQNANARVFTYEQALAGGGGAPLSYPLGATTSVDGVYAGMHVSSNSDTSNSSNNSQQSTSPQLTPSSDNATSGNTTYTASANPILHQCNCAACRALATLAEGENEPLFSTIAVA